MGISNGGSCYNYKGNNGNGSNGVSRGRSYGKMLLIAFGAALLGVMILHKLRERRIFNLLIKDKDNELFSLHLLLQRERDYSKEVKSKNEDMKAKIYSLRTQKMELDRRLLEKQSTIDSLKDEQRVMEIAIEEMQNEIKMLRAQEAEIKDLKHRLQYRENVWSVSADDPSKPQVNNTTTNEAEQKGVTTSDENGSKAGYENTTSEDRGHEHDKNEEDSKDENVASLSNLNVANSSEEVKAEGDEKLGKLENSQEEGEENPGSSTAKGEVKTEGKEGFEKNGRRGGSISSNNNTKEKRWRIIAKSRRLENNGKISGVTRTRSAIRFPKDHNGDSESRVTERAASNGGVLIVEHNQKFEGRKSEDSSSSEMPRKDEVSLDTRDVKESGSNSEGVSDEEDLKEEIDESEF